MALVIDQSNGPVDDRLSSQVRFFINGDKFFKGALIAVSAEKFRTYEKLLEHLTRVMLNQVSSVGRHTCV